MDLLSFLRNSPSPYHAVDTASTLLLARGFTKLNDGEWKLKKGKYFYTGNGSSLIAFTVGSAPSGVSIIGCHTDSPCLKLKPNQEAGAKVGVQTYGGGLWHTWFDRDLGLAGRIVLGSEKGIKSKLIKIDEPLMRIPTLAIHLDRNVKDGFVFNNETHLTPIGTELNIIKKIQASQNEEILDFDLSLFDVNPPCLGGSDKEFIYSARLDNLLMSYCAIDAILEAEVTDQVKLIALFDNEEVGSVSHSGADSSMLPNILDKIAKSFQSSVDSWAPNNFFLSADCAHALHPNYTEKHEGSHQPQMGKGVVLKYNANQRYTTCGLSASIIKKLAQKVNCPLQVIQINFSRLL